MSNKFGGKPVSKGKRDPIGTGVSTPKTGPRAKAVAGIDPGTSKFPSRGTVNPVK